ncbi:MAG: hypothetical protein AAF708_03850 [Deinococcota bacterium]
MKDVAAVSSQPVSRLSQSPKYAFGEQKLVTTAKQAILHKLEQTPTPLRVRELIQQIGLEAHTLKRALWLLVDEGRVNFTEDRRVRRHKHA